MTLTLNDLETLHLSEGSHKTPADGCCLMEAASMFAKEPFGDQPKCVSPYLRSFGIRLNDRANDTQRQDLRRFIPLVVGTAGDGKDETRRWIGADYAIRVALPRWLDAAGLTEHATALRDLPQIIDRAGYARSRPTVNAARDAAYALRTKKLGGKTRYQYVYDLVKAKLAEQPNSAVAVAVADAAAVAVAAAAAAADAAAAAAAVAVAAAAAAADADAAAAAVAVAVADAAAVAVAAARVRFGTKEYAAVRKAAYDAARAVYEQRYGDLIAISWTDACDLYGRLITAA